MTPRRQPGAEHLHAVADEHVEERLILGSLEAAESKATVEVDVAGKPVDMIGLVGAVALADPLLNVLIGPLYARDALPVLVPMAAAG
jgi:hypothetical protein